jgi:hypothetical protein
VVGVVVPPGQLLGLKETLAPIGQDLIPAAEKLGRQQGLIKEIAVLRQGLSQQGLLKLSGGRRQLRMGRH